MTGLLLEAFIYLAAAVVAVPLAKRLGLGSVLGYLVAGVVIGPVLGLVGAQLHYRDIAVEWIVLPHRLDQGSAEVDAHLPVHRRWSGRSGPVYEGTCGDDPQFTGPACKAGLSGCPAQLIQRVHPLRQIVKVLTVALPLEPLI